MSVIRASVTDQRLKITEAPVLASGGQNETKVAFTFCEKWTGFTKTATFYRDESEVYSIPLDANDTCVVPWEVCNESGTFYIGVFGDKDNVRRTSTTVRYRVKNGAITEGTSPSEPTPDRYAQLAAEVKSFTSELHTHIENCGTTDTDSVFYGNLADAVAEQNAVTDSTAPVEVFTAENGEKIVRLLANVSESAQIDITTDMTLVLNGHTLNLTTASAKLNFVAGTNCTINGEVKGSAIKKENITATGNTNVMTFLGDNLRVCGGYYSIGGNFTAIPIVFGVGANCKVFELDGAEVLATNTSTSTKKTIKCVQSQAAKTILKNSKLTSQAQIMAQPVHVVAASGTLEISDCNIVATTVVEADGVSANAVNVTAIYDITDSTITTSGYRASAITNNGNGNIKNSSISASGFEAIGIENKTGKTVVKDSSVLTDAHGAHAGDGCSHSIGVWAYNGVTTVCIDTDVTGTHSGVQNSGNLFVKGGTFSGYSHGGFYFVHEAEHKVYINNATLEVGVYHGSFEDFGTGGVDDPTRAAALAGFYMGEGHGDVSYGISVYMDGCTFEGTANELFVVRPAAEGLVNTLYISNTGNNSNATSIRLNKEDTTGTKRAEMKIGMGCSFTPANTTNPECAEETGKLYRRMKDDMPVDARDLNALIAMH